jgi:hypothetical protein
MDGANAARISIAIREWARERATQQDGVESAAGDP